MTWKKLLLIWLENVVKETLLYCFVKTLSQVINCDWKPGAGPGCLGSVLTTLRKFLSLEEEISNCWNFFCLKIFIVKKYGWEKKIQRSNSFLTILLNFIDEKSIVRILNQRQCYKYRCVKGVQIRSFFWFVFGHFSHSV